MLPKCCKDFTGEADRAYTTSKKKIKKFKGIVAMVAKRLQGLQLVIRPSYHHPLATSLHFQPFVVMLLHHF